MEIGILIPVVTGTTPQLKLGFSAVLCGFAGAIIIIPIYKTVHDPS
jgi:hypothetical protein